MRRLSLALVSTLGLALTAPPAVATPFDARRIPAVADAVGHIDVDALKTTQLYARFGSKLAPDEVSKDMPPQLRALVIALVKSARGVSFWMQDTDNGAIYVETSAPAEIQRLMAALPARGARTIAGKRVQVVVHDKKDVLLVMLGNTVVFTQRPEIMRRSIQAIGGTIKSVASSNKLPRATARGVFFFAALGGSVLDNIKKGASSTMMQVDMRSLLIDAAETRGKVAMHVRAEMTTVDAPQKAKSVLEGLRALASLADEAKQVRPLLDRLRVTTRGKTLEVALDMPASELVKVLESMK